jgi:hypothetical protein
VNCATNAVIKAPTVTVSTNVVCMTQPKSTPSGVVVSTLWGTDAPYHGR